MRTGIIVVQDDKTFMVIFTELCNNFRKINGRVPVTIYGIEYLTAGRTGRGGSVWFNLFLTSSIDTYAAGIQPGTLRSGGDPLDRRRASRRAAAEAGAPFVGTSCRRRPQTGRRSPTRLLLVARGYLLFGLALVNRVEGWTGRRTNRDCGSDATRPYKVVGEQLRRWGELSQHLAYLAGEFPLEGSYFIILVRGALGRKHATCTNFALEYATDVAHPGSYAGVLVYYCSVRVHYRSCRLCRLRKASATGSRDADRSPHSALYRCCRHRPAELLVRTQQMLHSFERRRAHFVNHRFSTPFGGSFSRTLARERPRPIRGHRGGGVDGLNYSHVQAVHVMADLKNRPAFAPAL
ncbi:hypothetical protein EVAR_87995_1 [Eumeta japonica]|uniref:Uncharacterized protein n=1 Tax=Eumeta variegata TaxID=151549 RepID=A0A4C1VCA9_EUMVA|nr:hypothetical protein EVAR_87995_1 [Eumeta japonica]